MIIKKASDCIHQEIQILKADRITLPLTIRHRRPGNRMTVSGLGGSKKNKKDILIDEKIPQKNRDKLWIIADGTGKIIWLIGLRKAENIFWPFDQCEKAGTDDLF